MFSITTNNLVCLSPLKYFREWLLLCRSFVFNESLFSSPKSCLCTFESSANQVMSLLPSTTAKHGSYAGKVNIPLCVTANSKQVKILLLHYDTRQRMKLARRIDKSVKEPITMQQIAEVHPDCPHDFASSSLLDEDGGTSSPIRFSLAL